MDAVNVTTGVPLAGLPATILARAQALRAAGAEVFLLVGDRGMSAQVARDWQFPGLLVNPDLLYGPAHRFVPYLRALSPDLIIVTDAELAVRNGCVWARETGAHLIYEAHDDEESLSKSVGDTNALARAMWQRRACLAADHVTVLAPRELRVMQRLGADSANLMIAPLSVNTRQRTAWGPATEARRLLFLGNLHYPPNGEALTNIFGIVKDLDVCTRVIGHGPDELLSPRAGFEFMGAVPDLDPALQGISLALAPITSGSGPKCKMLEFLSAGIPVLATSEAVNGLRLDHPGVVVCDDLKQWPDLIVTLLDDPESLREIGKAGRAYAEQRDPAALASRALATYKSWLSSPARTGEPVEHPHTEEPRWLADNAAILGAPLLTKENPALPLPLVQ